MDTPYIPDKWKNLKLEIRKKPTSNIHDVNKQDDVNKHKDVKSILKNKKHVYNEPHHKEYNLCEQQKKSCIIL